MSLATKFRAKLQDYFFTLIFSAIGLLSLIIWRAIPVEVWNKLDTIMPKKALAALIGLLLIVVAILVPYIFSLRRQRRFSIQPEGSPDLSGRWEGWTYRSITREWRPSAEEIIQDELGIRANAWGPDNWARAISASIIHDRAAYELVWSYQTVPTTPNYQGGDSHTGTHFLRYSERDGERFLEGRYVTDRPRDDGTMGTGGFVMLKWVSDKRKTALNYDRTKSWGLPEPNAKANPLSARFEQIVSGNSS
jgi:hypothetical protein